MRLCVTYAYDSIARRMIRSPSSLPVRSLPLSIHGSSTHRSGFHHTALGTTVTRPCRASVSRRVPTLSSKTSLYNTKFLQRNSSAIAKDGMPSFAFAFDIDGVLLRSSKPIEGATRGLQYLEKHNIPFILLTNGGGKHESVRVAELSEKLKVKLTEENFVQSHTPFKALVEGTGELDALKHKTILVTGGHGEKVRKVAEQYGFTKVVTPGDILMADPAVWPFNQVFTDYYKTSTRALPHPVDLTNLSQSLKFDAIFVFNDPRDWALDAQIIMDLLMSQEGILGTYSSKNGDASLPNNGWQQDNQPKLYFSNPDMYWASAYHLPRIGQGGFQAAIQGIWEATTGGAKLEKTVIGKPYSHTYEYSETVLNRHRAELLGGKAQVKRDVSKLERVFMIGDNPESDIRGANEFKSPLGTEWTSVLVRSGVYRDGSVPAYKPKVIVDDVLEGIKWALKQEGWKGEI